MGKLSDYALPLNAPCQETGGAERRHDGCHVSGCRAKGKSLFVLCETAEMVSDPLLSLPVQRGAWWGGLHPLAPLRILQDWGWGSSLSEFGSLPSFGGMATLLSLLWAARALQNSALRHVITEEYKIWFCWKHFSCSHSVEQLWFKLQSQASGQMCDLSAYCLHAFTWALDLAGWWWHIPASAHRTWKSLSHSSSGNKFGDSPAAQI